MELDEDVATDVETSYLNGSVTLIEKFSGAIELEHAAMKPRWRLFTFQETTPVAATSCQSAKRSAISVRHSSAVSRCRQGLKCGEMRPKAVRNRCACPGEVKRFIVCSRCRVG